MDMTLEHRQSGVMLIVLAGRMDIAGAMAVDLRFAATVASNRAVIVDISKVVFLASMGLRTLIMGAKSMHTKSGRMMLLSPSAEVAEVLMTSGTDTLIPIMHDMEEAERWMLA